MFDIYVICLEKTKDNRCLPTIRSLENDKYKIILFKAITPDDFNLHSNLIHPYVQTNIINGKRSHTDFIGSTGEIGCALSHIELWKKCVAMNRPIIISEDDNILPKSKVDLMLKGLEHIPKDADIFYLRHMSIHMDREKVKDNPNNIYKLNYFYGTQMYYITPQCCKKLLKNVFPLTFQIDIYMTNCIKPYNLKVYATSDAPISHYTYAKDFLESTLSRNLYKIDYIRLIIHQGITLLIIIILIIVIVYLLCKK